MNDRTRYAHTMAAICLIAGAISLLACVFGVLDLLVDPSYASFAVIGLGLGLGILFLALNAGLYLLLDLRADLPPREKPGESRDN